MNINIFLVVVALLVLCSSGAQAYYADVVIDVSSTGLVSISGQTDAPNFLTQNSQQLTSKNNGLWLLNITLPEELSPFVYEIQLPSDVEINYMHLPSLLRVESTPNGLVISGVSSQAKDDLLVQYSLLSSRVVSSSLYTVIALVVVFLFLAVLIFFKFKKRSVRVKFGSKKHIRSSRFMALPSRQKLILKAILKQGDFITQAQLEKELLIPKASLSRNVASLCQKGFLRKEKTGMTNTLYLQETILK